MFLEIADQSQVASARRAAVELARARGFDDVQVGRIALIATELTTNILKHAQRGALAIATFADSSGSGLELMALDKGAGIVDIARAMENGMSTAGSPGTGLGAIRRQADQFVIFSRPHLGTAVMARVRNRTAPASADKMEIGAVEAACPGETVSGDGWGFGTSPAGPSLFMADGTGHGRLANVAAETAVRVFREHLADNAVAIIQEIHRALTSTRGAAIAVARLDRSSRVVHFAGLGNITGAVISPAGDTRRMVSHHGTAGHVAARISEFSYPCPDGSLILLHSDGLSAKWDLSAYPGLAASHPSVVAGLLFRDFRRRNDDATVIAMRV